MADVEINLEITNPQELIGLGLRAYAIGDFSNAAAAFGRATQLLAQEHGDEHDSLGEVYLNYAKALLEVSREEAEPLGDAIPHGDSDSDSEDAETENGTTESKDEPADKPDEPKDETAEVNKADDGELAQNGDTKATQVADDDETKPNESGDAQVQDADQNQVKEEDCTDLQLAWEVLEVAKKIFTNRGDNGKALLSETLILLGEVAMESENFTDGVNDMKLGLDIQKGVLEPTSRKLAESYYKVGMALATVSNIEEAITSFELSIETLKKRIKMLQDMLETKVEGKCEENKTTENSDDKTVDDKEKKSRTIKRTKTEDEIKEMNALIPEIEEKINDTKSIKEEMAAKLIVEMSNSTSKSKEDGAGSSKTANDISHLVKRKRKNEEDPSEGADLNPCKKPSP